MSNEHINPNTEKLFLTIGDLRQAIYTAKSPADIQDVLLRARNEVMNEPLTSAMAQVVPHFNLTEHVRSDLIGKVILNDHETPWPKRWAAVSALLPVNGDTTDVTG